MADMRQVHNTSLSPLVVSRDGRRVLGCTTDTIDITEPRAQKYLNSGHLILVAQVQASGDAPQTPAPAPKTSKSK